MATTTFDNVDLSVVAKRTQDVMQDLGARDVADVAAKIAQIDAAAQNQSITTETANVMTRLADRDKTYQRNTDMLAQLNESWNANRYLFQTLATEEGRIGRMDSQAKKDIYKSRQGRMFTTYMTNYYVFATRMTIFTLYATLLILLPTALWQAQYISFFMMVTMVAVVLGVYLFVAGVMMYQAAKRRTTDWRRFYHKLGEIKMKTGGDDEHCAVTTTPTPTTTTTTR